MLQFLFQTLLPRQVLLVVIETYTLLNQIQGYDQILALVDWMLTRYKRSHLNNARCIYNKAFFSPIY